MENLEAKDPIESAQPATQLPAYEPPVLTTYTDEQLLEALGPAQAARYGPPA